MENYYKNINSIYIASLSVDWGATEITKAEYAGILSKIQSKPADPDGYTYKLRADNLEWELVELPPVEPEPLTDEDALVRYSNELTGADDPDLISAAETLIKQRMEES